MKNAQEEEEEVPFSFPSAIRHSLVLSNGRTLSYNTFETTTGDDAAAAAAGRHLHPVLYLHGFPGSGLEGAICAQKVSEAGGELFALDRPGFGYSNAYPKDLQDDADKRVEYFCQNVWEMIALLKWKSFSVISVSGGGPYGLALLESYMTMLNNTDDAPPPPARLDAVSLVAGVCCSAGIQDMMDTNQMLFRLVKTKSRFQLGAMFWIPKVLLSILPTSFMTKFVTFKEQPPVDQEIMGNPAVAKFMLSVLAEALRQGTSAAVLEAMVLFRSGSKFETSLQKLDKQRNMPKVSIFQGLIDVNVPPSHSLYVHKELLQECSELHTYPDLGHASLVGTKGRDYAKTAIPDNAELTNKTREGE